MKRKKNKRSEKKERFKKEIIGVFFIFLGIFLFLSFFKGGGKIGEVLFSFLNSFFGKGVYLFPFIFVLEGFVFFQKKEINFFWNFGGLLAQIFLFSLFFEIFQQNWGGEIGIFFGEFLKTFLGAPGSLILILFLIVLSFSFQIGVPLKDLFKKLIPQRKKEIKEPKFQKVSSKLKVSPEKEKKSKPLFLSKLPIKTKAPKEDFYKTLPLDLLEKEESSPISGDLKTNAKIIQKTLENFGIPVEMGEINVGPTVTQYTFRPAQGIKLSKVISLQNDLALALASHPIRIEAPIPGKSLVGVEVPNKKRVIVRLRNVISFPGFKKTPLTFALGKDVRGNPSFASLERMPHLLVAGATGTGKTVFLNSMIVSFLLKNSPQILRLILVDPKRVEFNLYEGVPHLLAFQPIISYSKVLPALKWLIEEMQERLEILKMARKQDIEAFNKDKEVTKKYKKIPYLLLIIDELADIMISKGKEFESLVVRLAQLGRAVGIHLILSTQRPSVEVLTGLIKANITSRVAFQVPSQVDSRTILDVAGAERLLGRGDMLFLGPESAKPKRYQAPFVSSREIKKVCEYVKKRDSKREKDELDLRFEEYLKEAEKKEKEGIPIDDELYEEAKRLVIEAQKASASFLQRRLKIGYARAARLLDMLESEGIVGPAQGAKPREVLVKKEEFEKNNEKDF